MPHTECDGNVESQRNLSLVRSILFKYNNDGFFILKLILKSKLLYYFFPD